MDARTAVMQYMCPALGVVIAFCMFISPLPAVLRVDKKKELGDLNALPYTAMASNGLGWIVYGIVIHDYFVYGSNISGLLLGLFYIMTCYKYSNEKAQDVMRNILLAVCVLFLAMALVHMAAGLEGHQKETLWGSNAVAILAVYYVTPLSTLANVLRHRDSSSLQRPLLLANLANGIMWFCYGIAIADWFLIAPNGIGAAFSLLSLVLSFVIPRKSSSSSSSTARGSSSRDDRTGSSIDLLPVADSSKGKVAAAAAAAEGPEGRDSDADCLPHSDQMVGGLSASNIETLCK